MKLWLKLLVDSAGPTFSAVKVDCASSNCEDIADLIEALKLKLSPKLDKIALSDISITNFQGALLKPGLLLLDLIHVSDCLMCILLDARVC